MGNLQGEVMEVSFTLNGKIITVDYEEGMSVLEVLREICLIKSCKDGCSGQGSCGACTVRIDGKAILNKKSSQNLW